MHHKQHSPSCERNREPILKVLRDVLPPSGTVLEIGSGTGQHAAFFASKLPHIEWQPTDRPGCLDSVRAWYEESALENLRPPLEFDLFDASWPIEHCDAIVCINVLHIAPASVIAHLFQGSGRVLNPGGIVYVYGPYRYQNKALEPSNEAFDEWLMQRNPESGIRLFEDVNQIAEQQGFRFENDIAMPANNRSIWWRKGE